MSWEQTDLAERYKEWMQRQEDDDPLLGDKIRRWMERNDREPPRPSRPPTPAQLAARLRRKLQYAARPPKQSRAKITVHTGPRGGRFIIRNGAKVYLKAKY